MKKITIIITLLITSLGFGQTNLFVNGDFETGATTGAGWQNGVSGYSYTTQAVEFGTIMGAYTVDVSAHSGTFYGVKKSGSTAFQQGVDVTPGKTYVVGFWFYNSYNTNAIATRIASFTGDVFGTFLDLTPIVADTGMNAGDATKYGARQTGGRVWKEAKFFFTVPAGVTRVRFQYWSNDTGFNFMDDAVMYETNSWTGTVDSDWNNAGNWSYGVVPTATDVVEIPASSNAVISSTTGANAFQLTVDPTATLTIEAGGSLDVDGTAIGNITYKRSLVGGKWHLVSSPVVGATYNDTWVTDNGIEISASGNRGISFYQNGAPHATTFQWTYMQAGGFGTFENSKGYSLRREVTGDVSFTGTYPIGAKPAVVTSPTTAGTNKFNLIGNPYPTYLTIAQFFVPQASTPLTSNTFENGRLTEDTIWLWNQGADAYVPKTSLNHDSEQIAPGQAFFISSKDASDIVFYQYNGTHKTAGDTFLKTTPTSKVNLKIDNGTNALTTELFYRAEGTNDFDNGYDASMFTGVASNFSLYTSQLSNAAKKLAIQTLSDSSLETLVIPVGIKAAAGQEITFTAEAMNLPEGIKVFLEDRENNTITRLDEANSSYKITLANAIDGNGRFFLHTKASSVLSTEDIALENVSIYKTSNTTLRVVGLENGISSNIKMYNVTGKQVLNSNFQSKGGFDIALPRLATGMYIVQLQNENGRINKKIILE